MESAGTIEINHNSATKFPLDLCRGTLGFDTIGGAATGGDATPLLPPPLAAGCSCGVPCGQVLQVVLPPVHWKETQKFTNQMCNVINFEDLSDDFDQGAKS